MAACTWNESIPAAVFTDDEGRIVLVVLTKPKNDILTAWERDYPDLPIRQGIADCFPEVT